MRIIERLLLLAFPRSFRERHGRALVQVLLTDSRKESGRPSTLRILAAIPEMVRAGFAERMRGVLIPAGDLRLALRRWRRQPVFAITAIVTLALGIGATTALFSVVEAVILRPLPYPDADRVVVIYGVYPARQRIPASATTWNRGTLTCGMWDALRAAPVFQNVGVWRPYPTGRLTIGEARTEIVEATEVSSNFFHVLGSRITAGPGFTDRDDRTATHVALLPDETWRRRFGARPNAVGETIATGDAASGGRSSRTIVGVVKTGFRFEGGTPEFFFNVGTSAESCRSYDSGAFRAVARLADGVSLAAAETEADGRVRALRGNEPATVRLVPLYDDQVGQAAQPLWMLFGGAILLLLVGCANVAGLLLGDARTRQHEMGVRMAIGGSRPRLLRQLAVEYALLALAGSGLGVAAAFNLMRPLIALAPSALPRIETIAIDLRIAVVAVGVGMATVLLFGFAPAVSLLRTPSAGTSPCNGREATRPRLFSHRAAVAAQIAAAVVLLAATVLFDETLFRLAALPLGFNPSNLAVVSTTYTGPSFDPADAAHLRGALGQPNFREVQQEYLRATASRRATAVRERLLALPGVVGVAATSAAPFLATSMPAQVRVDRQPTGEEPRAWMNVVTDSFFATMGTRVMRGRLFDALDRGDTALVAVVSQEFERQFIGPNAVGQRFTSETGLRRTFEIVGVVEDIQRRDRTSPPEPVFYSVDRQSQLGRSALIVRTAVPSETVLPLIREGLKAVNPQIVATDSTTMDALLARLVAHERFRATLSVCFGVAALLLATIGVYGIVLRRVLDRRHEFAVRVALGAAPADVGRLVVKDAMAIVGAGLAAGLPAAYAASRFARAMLFGVTPTAPHIYLGAAGILALATLIALAGPLHRARRLDTVSALKE